MLIAFTRHRLPRALALGQPPPAAPGIATTDALTIIDNGERR